MYEVYHIGLNKTRVVQIEPAIFVENTRKLLAWLV
jgi:hypothetical protein